MTLQIKANDPKGQYYTTILYGFIFFSSSPISSLKYILHRDYPSASKMVKVLENQVVDLDVMPGKKPEDIQNQVQGQVDAAGYARHFCYSISSLLLPQADSFVKEPNSRSHRESTCRKGAGSRCCWWSPENRRGFGKYNRRSCQRRSRYGREHRESHSAMSPSPRYPSVAWFFVLDTASNSSG